MKLRIKEAIVVEGRYDKNTVSQVADTVIIETSGFGIFSDKEKLSLIRKIAEKRGIVVFTDSDGAGFVIRNHLKGSLPAELIKQAYIPDIYGKERRKTTASKEGKIGVEGMPPEVIKDCLLRAGATILNETGEPEIKKDPLTKTDLFMLGLSGKAGSAEKRRMLTQKLGLPERISPNALLDVLNALYTREEFYDLTF